MADFPKITRRGALSYGLGVGTGVAATACAGAFDAPHPAGSRGADLANSFLLGQVNVRSFGAVGDGQADDTAAIANAVRSAGQHVSLYFPPGMYLVTSFPELPDNSVMVGAGPDLSIVLYKGDDVLIKIRNKRLVAFADITFLIDSANGTGMQISNSFRCSLNNVVLRGNHVGKNFPQYQQQRGLILDENSGGTTLINCEISNFGTALITKCIQNYLTNCKFDMNHTSILGTGNDFNAGLSIVNTEFVSDGDERSTVAHIRVDGAANDWFITNVWFEGCDVAVDIGAPGGGPSLFGMVNAKVAARKTGIVLRHCRQPYLANVSFDEDTDQSAAPVPLSIDADGCPEGTAIGMIFDTKEMPPIDMFPRGWNVMLQNGFFSNQLLSPLNMLQPVIALSPDAAPILADGSNGFWQLQVDANGKLSTRSAPPPK